MFMKKAGFKNIVILLLLLLAVYSIRQYRSSIKSKSRLLTELEESKNQVLALEEEKQNLLQELEKEKELQAQLRRKNTGLKGYLDASRKRLNRLFADYVVTQKRLEELDRQLASARAEETAGRIKSRVHIAKRQINSRMSDRSLAGGNCGFLVKDGENTYKSGKVKIKVTSLAVPDS